MIDAIRDLFSGGRSDETKKEGSSKEKASLSDTQAALNAVAGKKGFRCVPVSWEDAQRGTVDGALSCWGGNISDVRLWAKDGTLLYTLRTENWNERLGYVASKDVAVVVGNHVRGGEPYTPVTLQRYLKSFREYAGYAGVESEQLFDEKADQLLSVRFQAVFLPIADEETSEFCTEVYNYNTHSDDDPRNVALLCTAQGTHVQQDGSGAKKMFIHNVDGTGKVHRYWLEAERSKHQVGGAQLETEEEAAAAAARGKATAIHIGTKEMGTRFNVQMLIQLPVQQKPKPPPRAYETFSSAPLLGGGGISYLSYSSQPGVCYSSGATGGPISFCSAPMPVQCNFVPSCPPPKPYQSSCLPPSMPPPCSAPVSAPSGNMSTVTESRQEQTHTPQPSLGTSNAARVSRGSEHDTWAGVNNKKPVRDPSQHGTITVTLYYTVAGGIPSPEDVERCVDDLDSLYKACPTDKRLVDCGEITAELKVKDMNDIGKKVTEEPFQPEK